MNTFKRAATLDVDFIGNLESQGRPERFSDSVSSVKVSSFCAKADSVLSRA